MSKIGYIVDDCYIKMLLMCFVISTCTCIQPFMIIQIDSVVQCFLTPKNKVLLHKMPLVLHLFYSCFIIKFRII